MENNEGGPAFPQPCTENGYAANTPYGMAGGGMTLRDYFAAHAPVTIDDAVRALQCVGNNEPTGGEIFSMMSAMRFGYADAMLKARNA